MYGMPDKRMLNCCVDQGGEGSRPVAPRATKVVAGAVLFLAGGIFTGTAWSWDVSVTGLAAMDPSVKISFFDPAGMAAAGKQMFDEGAKLRLICTYAYGGAVQPPPSWRIEFTVDGKPIGSKQAVIPGIITKSTSNTYFDPNPLDPGIKSTSTHSTSYTDPTHAAEIDWTASGDGPRTLQCVLNPDKAPGESNANNNITQTKITVNRFKPLAGGDLPPVQLLNPAGGPSFVLASALQIPLNGKVVSKSTGGKKDPVEYAKASPFDERWHIEIVSRGSGALSGFETTLGEFSGPVTGLNFTGQLTGAWLQQRNAKPGKYAARAFVSQTASGTTVTGPNSRVEFELKELQRANIGIQPVPSVLTVPRGSMFAVPPPPLPVGRGLPPVPQPAAPAVTRMPAQAMPNPPAPRSSAPAAAGAPAQVLPNLPAVQQPAGAPLQPSVPAAVRTPAQVLPKLPTVQQPAEIRLR